MLISQKLSRLGGTICDDKISSIPTTKVHQKLHTIGYFQGFILENPQGGHAFGEQYSILKG